MFIGIFNISYFVFIGLHYLGLFDIPDVLRLILAIVFILINIFVLFKNKVLKTKESKDDDFFVFSDNPSNPSSPSPEARKFMEDLNNYVKDKEKMKIRR